MNARTIPSAVLTCSDIAAIAGGRLSVASGLAADPELRAAWEARRATLLAQGGRHIYGVDTGFGASCTNFVGTAGEHALAANLFAYHGCGVGQAFSEPEGAAILAVRIAQLASGHSALSPATFDALVTLLAERIIPMIPELGSVGASGDLTPLSYVAAVLAGERECFVEGQQLPARVALEARGLAPHTLGPKESLSLMNGTSVMSAIAALGCVRAQAFATMHAASTALTIAALHARKDHFDARIFQAKPHPGSLRYAQWVTDFLAEYTNGEGRGGVQDPYSLRCAPHVVGVLVEACAHAADVLEREINGASDNPLVCTQTGDVLHGGNFYGGHVAFVCDGLKAQVAGAAEVLERQLMLLTQPQRNRGLPENLVLADDANAQPGVRHGFKAMEILASSLVAEALKLTMPASAFSRSTEGHNQDKVSMGTIAARDLRSVLDLSETVLIVALLAGAQGLDARGGRSVVPPNLRDLYDAIRRIAPKVTQDRRQDTDITALLTHYRRGELHATLGGLQGGLLGDVPARPST